MSVLDVDPVLRITKETERGTAVWSVNLPAPTNPVSLAWHVRTCPVADTGTAHAQLLLLSQNLSITVTFAMVAISATFDELLASYIGFKCLDIYVCNV